MPANEALFDAVRSHAFGTLSYNQRRSVNLYLDQRIYKSGEPIGPRRQKIAADKPTALVFADDNPMANFSHPCRYLLYDGASGSFMREVPAQFPPFMAEAKSTIQPFHEPLKFIDGTVLYPVRPIFRCPIIVPSGRRYAILFSGMSNKRHLNDMEFLYRTLIDHYLFRASDIYALNYDGTLNTQDGVQTHWPGDGSAYRIHITGQGTRAAFEAAIDDLKTKLKAGDLLLIHTNNHGGYDGTPGTANLCTYPSWDGYYANDFANKLNQLPKFDKLIVMMEQCHAGGFNAPIVAKSTANATSVASAATEPNSSYVTADGNWDPFARDWIAAQAGHDAFGAGLAFNPDANGDGAIQATEAYDYADSVRDPRDTPNFSENSAAGGAVTLGQQYKVYWWWCIILRELLERHYVKLPPVEYADRLQKIEPELVKLTQSLDKTALEMRKQYTEKVAALVKTVFG